jgi:hypothetical protein
MEGRALEAIQNATLPYSFAPVVRRVLKRTPEYRQALAEHRAKEWLNDEAYSLCQVLAEVTRDRLKALEP